MAIGKGNNGNIDFYKESNADDDVDDDDDDDFDGGLLNLASGTARYRSMDSERKKLQAPQIRPHGTSWEILVEGVKGTFLQARPNSPSSAFAVLKPKRRSCWVGFEMSNLVGGMGQCPGDRQEHPKSQSRS